MVAAFGIQIPQVFTAAARALGATHARVVARHVLPNLASLVIVIRQAWRIFRRSDDQPLQLFALAFIIGSAGILFGAMGDNVFSQPSVASYFWIMAGLIMAITRHMMPAAVQDTAATP